MSASSVLSAATNGILVVCAVAITGSVLYSNYQRGTAETASGVFESQPDWLDYSDRGQWIGDSTAPVLLIEFGDFQCPACRMLSERLLELRERRSQDVRVLYRHLPIPRNRFAQAAASAAECAARFGRFTAMHDALYAAQPEIGVRAWQTFALEAGIRDTGSFNACMADPAIAAAIDGDVKAADKLRATGTPTLLVNGARFTGVPFSSTLDSVVDAALSSRARERRNAGR